MLAETLVEILQEGGLFEALADAGRRIDRQEKYSHEYQKLFDEFIADPEDETKRKAVEEAEEKFSAFEDYNTFQEMGEKQADYLKAMDFMDI
eukprot:2899918-Lingulodinium_polyedra.AAC.1